MNASSALTSGFDLTGASMPKFARTGVTGGEGGCEVVEATEMTSTVRCAM